MADVAFVIYEGLPEIHAEDVPLARALEQRGLTWAGVPWTANVDWREHRIALLRSTWDYHRRHAEFLAWVDRVSRETTLLNPAPVVKWNSDKRYLRELESKAVPIVPTEWLDRGAKADLRALLAKRGWERAVVKPSVSGGGWKTARVSAAALGDAQAQLDALLAERNAMVQPYVDAIEGYGERSIIWIDGRVTHGMRKTPAFVAGDAARFTGVAVLEGAPEATPVTPSPAEVAFALDVLGKVPHGPLLYARVDIAPGPMLMELELLEPTLFFTHSPDAANRMADALLRLR